MFSETFLVKEVLPQETFARAGQAPSLKQSVVFAYPNKEDNLLLITFYGDKVRDAMVLVPGDKVTVSFTLKSSKSAKGFWGTYPTGIFMKVIERAGDAPNEMKEYERMMEQGEEQVTDSLTSLGIPDPAQLDVDNDDIPF